MNIVNRSILLLNLIFILVGCGSRSANDTNTGYVYKKLSEQEAKKLITPTIYHIAYVDLRNNQSSGQSELNCPVESQRKMLSRSNEVLATVCLNQYKACLLQGTCRIQLDHKSLLLNVADKVDGQYRFKDLSNDVCQYGHGSSRDATQSFKKMCLDPYHSVAADLSIYKLGDVIYIPAFIGLKLKNNEVHDGYFIVRDSGSHIKGYGRFDFFIGDAIQGIDRQSFYNLDLADKNTHYPYFLINDAEAEKIRKDRNFPYLLSK